MMLPPPQFHHSRQGRPKQSNSYKVQRAILVDDAILSKLLLPFQHFFGFFIHEPMYLSSCWLNSPPHLIVSQELIGQKGGTFLQVIEGQLGKSVLVVADVHYNTIKLLSDRSINNLMLQDSEPFLSESIEAKNLANSKTKLSFLENEQQRLSWTFEDMQENQSLLRKINQILMKDDGFKEEQVVTYLTKQNEILEKNYHRIVYEN